ncbi:MAG: hypothetical protein QXH32_10695, partial [Candidatus Caldarchaeum sp.]
MWKANISTPLKKQAWVLAPIIYFMLRTSLTPLVQPLKHPLECINGPFDGCGFIFDEAHYIPAVRRMMTGEAVNLEHPPLSKWVI